MTVLSRDLGDGVTLGEVPPWQAEAFAAHVDAVRAFIEPWVPMAARVVDVASARAWLQRMADGHAADERHLWGIRRGGALVGGVLFPRFETWRGVGELGIWLAPTEVGRGLATRALEPLLQWAFEDRGLHRVEWLAATGNARSQALASRLGFTHEGTMREDYELLGRRQDTQLWALLAPDWRATRGSAQTVQ